MSKPSLPYNPQLVKHAREMRTRLTPAEFKLWSGYLRDFRYRVLRQRPIGQYIVDFYCATLHLVIEVDGASHFTQDDQEYDQRRNEQLQSYGLKVLRFTNDEVFENLAGVCQVIEEFASEEEKRKSQNPPCPP